ncbi:MAG: lycopene cyclase domain-containing protein [Saprospiraceae bacterium]
MYNIDHYLLSRLYTTVTFALLSLYFSLTVLFMYNITSHFYFYIFVLPFFLIVNGILTGSGIEEPVVWYNPDHHIGLRVGTIPIEDAFYGFLLISSIKTLSDFFKNQINKW